MLLHGALAKVEAEVAFHMSGVRAMAGEAFVGEDGTDVAIEIDSVGAKRADQSGEGDYSSEIHA